MRQHPVRRLELPDIVTIANVMFGFLAIVVISVETGSGGELGLAARLILLGVIADGQTACWLG
ncbi:hypothetical protein ACFQJ8_02395 [Halocatena marina]|uniref:hypothetical protein n=1 Tax=Halocatena marina TaxID=2934937 RepID=UPI003618745C